MQKRRWFRLWIISKQLVLPDKLYPEIQIITIKEFLNGKQLKYPRIAPEVTFKRAERKSKEKQAEQGQLF